MKMRKIYYKVILRHTRQSAIFSFKGISVKYLANEWVYPKVPNSKLMVFENENDAYSLIRNRTVTHMVVKCNVKNPIKAKNKYPILSPQTHYLYKFDSVMDFWKDIKNKDKRQTFIDWMDGVELSKCDDLKKKRTSYIKDFDLPPQGTILCDSVYCLE